MKYDLIIVGAGISGCVCALSALKHGVENILIIEKSKTPGGAFSSKIDFAEETGINNIFKELELPIYNRTNKSIWVSPGCIEFEFISKINDIWVKRGPSEDSFESIVINKLGDLGVDILLNTTGTKITNNIIKISGKNNSNTEFEGKIFVDAGGLKSVISKNIEKPPYTDVIGVGFWGEGFDLEVGVPYIFFDQNFASGSYVLVNIDPVSEIGYLILGTTEKQVNHQKILRKFIDSKEILRNAVKNVSIEGHISGHLYTIHRIPSIFQSDNLILVGDSARLMDPFLHYGIQPSVISGYLAGRSIGRYLAGEADITEYTTLINKNLINYIEKRMFYRKIFNKLNNNDIDKIFMFIDQLKHSGADIDNLFGNPAQYFPIILRLGIKNVSNIFSLFKNILK